MDCNGIFLFFSLWFLIWTFNFFSTGIIKLAFYGLIDFSLFLCYLKNYIFLLWSTKHFKLNKKIIFPIIYNIFVLHNFTLNHVSFSSKITFLPPVFLSPKTQHINWHKSVSSNGFIDVRLLEFGLTMQMGEVLHVVYFQSMGQLWSRFCMSPLHVKISLSCVVFKSKIWYF
jgi:hypothetical protein